MGKLVKEKAEREEEHVAEIKEVITEARSSAAEVVCVEKVKLAEDVQNARSWDVVGWREALANLIGRSINDCQDPGGEKREEEEEKKKKEKEEQKKKRESRPQLGMIKLSVWFDQLKNNLTFCL